VVKKRSVEKISTAVAIACLVGLIGWAAQGLIEIEKIQPTIESLQEESDDNRDSINELIRLHLKK